MMEVFPTWHQIPFSRQITFYRKEPFWLEAVYCNPDSVPHSNKMIGRFTVKNVKPTAEGEAMKVMVKLRINLHGIFSVSQVSEYLQKNYFLYGLFYSVFTFSRLIMWRNTTFRKRW